VNSRPATLGGRRANDYTAVLWIESSGFYRESEVMPKNNRKINRANHGKRPASSKARKAKRRKLGV